MTLAGFFCAQEGCLSRVGNKAQGVDRNFPDVLFSRALQKEPDFLALPPLKWGFMALYYFANTKGPVPYDSDNFLFC